MLAPGVAMAIRLGLDHALARLAALPLQHDRIARIGERRRRVGAAGEREKDDKGESGAHGSAIELLRLLVKRRPDRLVAAIGALRAALDAVEMAVDDAVLVAGRL